MYLRDILFRDVAEQSTDYAILGLLSIEPMSGYDIRQNFQESLNFFWSESYGQIYPALKRLATQGLITEIARQQNGRRERRMYTVTAPGRARLRAWLVRPARKQPVRDELLLKLLLGRLVPVSVCREHLRRTMGEQQRLLAIYEELQERINKERPGHAHARFWHLVLKHGIYVRRARLRWCKEALFELNAAPEKHKQTAQAK